MSSGGAMTEQDIRPDELRRRNAALRAHDVEAVLSRRDEFVTVCCPACGAGSSEPRFEKDGFAFVRCGACRTVFVSPRPTREMLLDFYAGALSVRHWQQELFPASEHGRRAHIFRPRAEQVVALCTKLALETTTLLDAGAGFGTFCEEVRRAGLFRRVVALEASPDMASACREKNLEVVEGPIEQCPQARLDVITAFELIEHVFSPQALLESCSDCLRPGGLLVLTTPNVEGFDVQILGASSRTFGAPEHLNYFHPDSLQDLLTRCGFAVLEWRTPGRLDAEMVRKEVLGGTPDLTSRPFLQRVLIDEWDRLGTAFQQFISDHGLSSHLWMVARKA